MIAPGGDLNFKPADRAALARALTGEPFGQADLDSPAPAVLIRRLQGFGLIARAD